MFGPSRVFAALKREFLHVLPPTVFFLVTFNIVAFTTAMALAEFKIEVSTHAVATMLALVIGKVVLVVDKLAMMRRFDGRPLVYPILFKSIMYSVFVLVVRLLEHWVPALIDTGSVVAATDHLANETAWRLFAFGQIWIFVLFVVYTTAVEVMTLFGLTARQLLAVFFRDHPTSMLETR